MVVSVKVFNTLLEFAVLYDSLPERLQHPVGTECGFTSALVPVRLRVVDSPGGHWHPPKYLLGLEWSGRQV